MWKCNFVNILKTENETRKWGSHSLTQMTDVETRTKKYIDCLDTEIVYTLKLKDPKISIYLAFN